MEPLINKVANKAIISIDPEDWYPKDTECLSLDLRDFLFQGLMLKEVDFRKAIAELPKEKFQDKYVAIGCSTDAIIPNWAYMLLSSAIAPYAKAVFACKPDELNLKAWRFALENMDVSDYEGQRLVVKGCGRYEAPADFYVLLMQRLQKVARAVNFGEACSMLPVYKKAL